MILIINGIYVDMSYLRKGFVLNFTCSFTRLLGNIYRNVGIIESNPFISRVVKFQGFSMFFLLSVENHARSMIINRNMTAHLLAR